MPFKEPDKLKINLNSSTCVKQLAKVQKTWKDMDHNHNNHKHNKAEWPGFQAPQQSA